jgi:hypothetical protein
VAPKNFPETISNFNLGTTDQYAKIKNLLTNPVLTITATTSGISSDTYILFLDEYQKSIGGFQQQMYEDYAQYFITTQFVFDRELYVDLYDFCQIDSNKNIVPVDVQQYFQESTPIESYVIPSGTFSGFTVYGNFFTYFLIPNKPKWETPYVTGQLNTFSPMFLWSNTDDGDSYLLQITYSTGSSQSFSGTVYSYPIDKASSNLSTEEMLNLPTGDWSIAQKATQTVREYSVPLAYGQTFWYRIGNVKELTNMFGVKQKVITFSDEASATTTLSSYAGQVYVQADSPHVADLSTIVYPEYLDGGVTLPPTYSLSGTVSGSVVTGATIILLYPTSSYVTTTTDLFGNYLFTQLNAGTYGIGVSYRGYQTINPLSYPIIITGNTTAPPIVLDWVWGNTWDTWGDLGDHHFS